MRLSEGMQLGGSDLSRYHAMGLKLFFRTPDRGADRVAFPRADFRERHKTSSISTATTTSASSGRRPCGRSTSMSRRGSSPPSDNYLREFVGKSNLTHYVWTEYGVAPSANRHPEVGRARTRGPEQNPPGMEHRLGR